VVECERWQMVCSLRLADSGEGRHSDIKTKARGMKKYRPYYIHDTHKKVKQEFCFHSLRNKQIVEQMCISMLLSNFT
jgi:hypothetical protein